MKVVHVSRLSWPYGPLWHKESGDDEVNVRGTLLRESINQCYFVKHSGVDLDTDICLSYLDNRLGLGHVPVLTVLLSWLLR